MHLDKESVLGGAITALTSMIIWLFKRNSGALEKQEERLREEFKRTLKDLRAEHVEKLAEERRLRAETAERAARDMLESSTMWRALMEALMSKMKIGTTYPQSPGPNANEQTDDYRQRQPTLPEHDPSDDGS